MMARKTALGLGAAGVAVAALAGCSSTGTTGANAADLAATTAASHPGAALAAAPMDAAVSGTACAASALRVSLGPRSGAAGSTYLYLRFRNVSSAACTLRGFPGVSMLTAAGEQIGAAAARMPGSSPSTVTVPAGGRASAVLRVVNAGNYDPDTCEPVESSSLRVYQPGATAAQTLPYPATGCASTSVRLLYVGAVQPGTGAEKNVPPLG